jgi:hypothetical protein
MASTITNATLAVTITEAVTLNGKSYGNINNLSVANVNEVDERIMTIPTSEVGVLDVRGCGRQRVLSSVQTSSTYASRTRTIPTSLARTSAIGAS